MMRQTNRILTFCLVFSLMGRGSAAQPRNVDAESTKTPAPYPDRFTIAFVTNITSGLQDEPDHPIAGTLYYDWNLQSQRMDHGAGSYECLRFYQTTAPCSLIFVPGGGMYRILHDDNNNQPTCCLDLPHVGTPPPDWAQQANPTWKGVVHDEYSGRFANQWTFDRLDPPVRNLDAAPDHSNFHTIRHVATSLSFAPLVFSFPGKAQGRQDFHYRLETLTLGPPDPKLFELPDGCQSVVCETVEVIPLHHQQDDYTDPM